MTQSLEELREAIRFVNDPKSYLGSDDGWAKVCTHDAAARCFLQLLETHTPEKIDALLKGEAWVAPNEITPALAIAAGSTPEFKSVNDALLIARNHGHELYTDEDLTAPLSAAWRAMRQSSNNPIKSST